jgi:hypothetical protein
MKSMNRREGKKIAVMAAVMVGLMMVAFMPMVSASVTSFTVTPSTGLAGAVDSYNALVTTTGVTSINITIPAGFIAVTPTTGGVEVARVDFWNESTRDYYGYGTITANNANPTTQVDIHCVFGGEDVTTTQTVNYTVGATNTFVSNVAGDTSSAIIKLPTATVNGSINITINCTAFQLDDVMIAIKKFVWNPTTAGDYDFIANGVTETVSITAAGGRAIVFSAPLWLVDSTGDHIADDFFGYGFAGATPLIGDINQDGKDDTAVVDLPLWFVDTTGDHLADDTFSYGFAGATPVVGDFNNDGKDDVAVVDLPMWFVDTDGDHAADDVFSYGFAGATSLVGDVNHDGTDDVVVVDLPIWFVDTNGDHAADIVFTYGFAGAIPLIGDFYRDGSDDIAVVNLPWWFVDTNIDHVADDTYCYGFMGAIPLIGYIG